MVPKFISLNSQAVNFGKVNVKVAPGSALSCAFSPTFGYLTLSTLSPRDCKKGNVNPEDGDKLCCEASAGDAAA